MFACSTYPTFDDAFMENVKAEFEDNIRRLRHHASIALWCGNNEIEMGLVSESWSARGMSWADYGKLFDKLLPKVVKKLDPARDYWPCSPHSPKGDRSDFNNPDCGDAHTWEVWHRKAPFEWYRTTNHRFYSEFGFQSFPEPKTVREFTLPKDRNITSKVMEHHQRSGIGNTTIMRYMLDWFRLPKSFDMTLWLSQILHGVGMKYAIEHFRRNMPRTMGALYWQLNDCWPVASWASIDSKCRWKALNYFAQRFFSPLLVCGFEQRQKSKEKAITSSEQILEGIKDSATGKVDVYVVSDLLKATNTKLTWTLTDIDGREIISDTTGVKALPGKSKKVFRLDVSEPLELLGEENALLWLDLAQKGISVSSNLVTFVKPKHLELPDPKITAKVTLLKGGAFVVTLKSKRPALWAWLELSGVDAEFSDNFVNLKPGREVQIIVFPAKKLTKTQLIKKLKVRSLVDTY
jgi:beta-mannosidase